MSDWLYNPDVELRIYEEGMRVATMEALSWLTESKKMVAHWITTLLGNPR